MNSAMLKAYGQILFAPATGSVLVSHLQVQNIIRLMHQVKYCLTISGEDYIGTFHCDASLCFNAHCIHCYGV